MRIATLEVLIPSGSYDLFISALLLWANKREEVERITITGSGE